MNVDDARRRIQELRHLNAFISLTDETGSGPVIAVKDLVDVRGTVTTGGGTFLPAVPAAEDAPCVQKTRSHGVVVVGKANLHEFAYGPTGENPHYGNIGNFHDATRISGGSSGGSAVAVAAGMCDWAIGTDTGGSIRIPAALNGVVGFKPTRGVVSTERVIALSPTLDTVGPIAPNVTTAARALEMMTDLKGLVPASVKTPERFRLAIPAGWFDDLDATTSAAWHRVAAGLPVIPFPTHQEMSAAQVVILQCEATFGHQKWMELYAGKYGADVLPRLQSGFAHRAVDYLHARAEERRLTQAAMAAMADIDALVLPVAPVIAPPIGNAEPLERLTRLTKGFSLTGQPVINIPVPSDGMPVGIQVVGHHGEEARLVEVALALEAAWKAIPIATS